MQRANATATLAPRLERDDLLNLASQGASTSRPNPRARFVRPKKTLLAMHAAVAGAGAPNAPGSLHSEWERIRGIWNELDSSLLVLQQHNAAQREGIRALRNEIDALRSQPTLRDVGASLLKLRLAGSPISAMAAAAPLRPDSLSDTLGYVMLAGALATVIFFLYAILMRQWEHREKMAAISMEKNGALLQIDEQPYPSLAAERHAPPPRNQAPVPSLAARRPLLRLRQVGGGPG